MILQSHGRHFSVMCRASSRLGKGRRYLDRVGDVLIVHVVACQLPIGGLQLGIASVVGSNFLCDACCACMVRCVLCERLKYVCEIARTVDVLITG